MLCRRGLRQVSFLQKLILQIPTVHIAVVHFSKLLLYLGLQAGHPLLLKRYCLASKVLRQSWHCGYVRYVQVKPRLQGTELDKQQIERLGVPVGRLQGCLPGQGSSPSVF